MVDFCIFWNMPVVPYSHIPGHMPRLPTHDQEYAGIENVSGLQLCRYAVYFTKCIYVQAINSQSKKYSTLSLFYSTWSLLRSSTWSLQTREANLIVCMRCGRLCITWNCLLIPYRTHIPGSADRFQQPSDITVLEWEKGYSYVVILLYAIFMHYCYSQSEYQVATNIWKCC